MLENLPDLKCFIPPDLGEPQRKFVEKSLERSKDRIEVCPGTRSSGQTLCLSFASLSGEQSKELHENYPNSRIASGFAEDQSQAQTLETLRASDILLSPYLLEELPWQLNKDEMADFEAKLLFLPPALADNAPAGKPSPETQFYIDWSSHSDEDAFSRDPQVEASRELGRTIKELIPDYCLKTPMMSRIAPLAVSTNKRQAMTILGAEAVLKRCSLTIARIPRVSPHRFIPFGIKPIFYDISPLQNPKQKNSLSNLRLILSHVQRAPAANTHNKTLALQLKPSEIWRKVEEVILSSQEGGGENAAQSDLAKLPIHPWSTSYPKRNELGETTPFSESWTDLFHNSQQLPEPIHFPAHFAMLQAAAHPSNFGTHVLEEWTIALLSNRPRQDSPIFEAWLQHFAVCVAEFPEFLAICEPLLERLSEDKREDFLPTSYHTWTTGLALQLLAPHWMSFHADKPDASLIDISNTAYRLVKHGWNSPFRTSLELYFLMIWGCASGNSEEAFEIARSSTDTDPSYAPRITQFACFALSSFLSPQANKFLSLVDETQLDHVESLNLILHAALAYALKGNTRISEKLLNRIFDSSPDLLVKTPTELGFDPCQHFALIYLVANRKQEFESLFAKAMEKKPSLAKVKSYLANRCPKLEDFHIPNFELPSLAPESPSSPQ